MPEGYFFLKPISYENPLGLFKVTSSGLEYIPIDINALSAYASRISMSEFKDLIKIQLKFVNQELDGINPFTNELLPIHTEKQRKGIENAKTLYEKLLEN
ncbi:hypothetical protein HQ489_04730 [Candidatus Woesearchaeota archaeon]|nr:hypothetical protein [Candidatus Woesearchaeota archaeon]